MFGSMLYPIYFIHTLLQNFIKIYNALTTFPHRGGIYLALRTDPKGDSCFSNCQNNGIKMHFIFKETIQSNPFFQFFRTRASCHFDFDLKIN